jgi:hypothetical protein
VGMGGFSLWRQAATPKVVGHGYFVSSGQINETMGTQGINDQFQVELNNIADPAPDKSYYGWLLPDKTQIESPVVFLGRLKVEQGTIKLLYKDEQQHTNLLAIISRFLITEEPATITPTVPSPDLATWRYYAELPQDANANGKSNSNMLSHFRHLLVQSPELKARNLHGGLTIWLSQNTLRVLSLANNARAAWQAKEYATARAQLVRIVDYLDGKDLARANLPGTSMLVNPVDAQIPLLGVPKNDPEADEYAHKDKMQPGYVYITGLHLSGLAQMSAATDEQRKLTSRILDALNKVGHDLEEVHKYAVDLALLPDAQFAKAASLTNLNNVVTYAQSAYAGHLNQESGQTQGGVVWIFGNVQRLADFTVKTYTP